MKQNSCIYKLNDSNAVVAPQNVIKLPQPLIVFDYFLLSTIRIVIDNCFSRLCLRGMLTCEGVNRAPTYGNTVAPPASTCDICNIMCLDRVVTNVSWRD